ncbi:MAG TPA: acetoacetate--CoA ligase [Ktedonobacteraceae bacterium]|nr:acetoacetate--CoA ligase [Ktedonobacteraceae bacterium]
MAIPIQEGTLLWQPSEAMQQQANVTGYMKWLANSRGLHFQSPDELWEWSVTRIEDFWASIWEYFHIQASKPYSTVLVERKMPGAQWFQGAELNYAQHIFRSATTEHPALLFQSEREPLREVSWSELRSKVSSIAHTLRSLGVQRGDRVVSYMPNLPETVMALLACASIGAIWSSCSPDFGTRSVIDRFKQIEPKVLFAIDGYQYNGREFDRRPVVQELQQSLPTLEKTILLPYLHKDVTTEGFAATLLWHNLLGQEAELTFEQVPFDHPLWVLYSSGTTGLPKAIVQGHGGILIEQLKSLTLGFDLKPGSRFFWFTTTGWMMWNVVVGSLLTGATSLLYDGSPSYPDLNTLWSFAAKTGMTFFGTSAGYIISCMKAGVEPGKTYDLSKLRAIGSTGSPLPPEGFQWVYEHVKKDLWLASSSGGTDVCTGFVGGSILRPVYAGELQSRLLGTKVEAFDEHGQPLIDEVGELVITEPMPSMPLYFWNDPGDKRYRESYFDMYPGVWRHGDWIKITPRGSAIIYGRSDSTINRMGIRMGSSEIYRVVEDMPEVLDSLIIGAELPGGRYYMPLFVVLKEDTVLDDALKARIREKIRSNVSPHHVPDEIITIQEVPRTLNGKKLEVPVKKLLMGTPPEKAINIDAVGTPQALQYFVEFARKRTSST